MSPILEHDVAEDMISLLHTQGAGNVRAITAHSGTVVLEPPYGQPGTAVTGASITYVLLTGAVTLKLPTAFAGAKKTVYLHQDTVGGRVVTWTGTIKWANGAAPVLQTGVTAVTRVTFEAVTIGGTLTWYASAAAAGGTPTPATQAIVSGTALHNTSGHAITVMVPVTATGAGGKYSLAIGSATTTTTTIVATALMETSGLVSLVTFRVPSGFWYKLTASTATIGTAIVTG